MPSPIVLPLRLTFWSSSGVSWPLTARLPYSPPSSFCQMTTCSGCRVVIPCSPNVCATSIADIEPTLPS